MSIPFWTSSKAPTPNEERILPPLGTSEIANYMAQVRAAEDQAQNPGLAQQAKSDGFESIVQDTQGRLRIRDEKIAAFVAEIKKAVGRRVLYRRQKDQPYFGQSYGDAPDIHEDILEAVQDEKYVKLLRPIGASGFFAEPLWLPITQFELLSVLPEDETSTELKPKRPAK